ncbi:hypothetical protein [Chroococcidiopsis sp.]|uniref:hypothetical protein n=1 Tax=Chroococcidiopsis sp. TaxID=3088168 RepID=UPI003F39FACB
MGCHGKRGVVGADFGRTPVLEQIVFRLNPPVRKSGEERFKAMLYTTSVVSYQLSVVRAAWWTYK